jgi:dipeptidyl aminopeptidase/acylaminoacyl peptidase
VACFFPPTDFLNYGKAGEDAIGRGTLANYAAAFDFREFDKEKKKFVTITDEARIVELGRKISPITHVSAKSAPTFIIHGDADLLVPLQQAETFLEKLKAAGVETKLVVKPGAAHGWGDLPKDAGQFVAWFDSHLKGAPAPAPAQPAEAAK